MAGNEQEDEGRCLGHPKTLPAEPRSAALALVESTVHGRGKGASVFEVGRGRRRMGELGRGASPPQDAGPGKKLRGISRGREPDTDHTYSRKEIQQKWSHPKICFALSRTAVAPVAQEQPVHNPLVLSTAPSRSSPSPSPTRGSPWSSESPG